VDLAPRVAFQGPNVTLAEPHLLFQRFAQDAGTFGGARTTFQMLVTNLVKVKYPDATTVEGSGGRDWGIDTFAGQLAGGQIRIWQSKFFLEWNADSSQNQVRASFKSAVENAVAKKHTITRWTLVVPCILPPDQLKWFQGFAKRNEKATGIVIDIWNGEELRHQLLRADARDVRREYFAHTMAPILADSVQPEQEPVQLTEDVAQFEGALFLHQLRAAGQIETDAACAMFYATEALLRDYTSRGHTSAISSMEELHLEVQDIWERHYNKEAPTADEAGRMPLLVDLVINDAAICANPPGLHLRPAHKKGTAHRLVENARAGWVTNWRDLATEHAAAAAASPASIAEADVTPVIDETPTTGSAAEPVAAADAVEVS
jgi:hypothetical protein